MKRSEWCSAVMASTKLATSPGSMSKDCMGRWMGQDGSDRTKEMGAVA